MPRILTLLVWPSEVLYSGKNSTKGRESKYFIIDLNCFGDRFCTNSIISCSGFSLQLIIVFSEWIWCIQEAINGYIDSEFTEQQLIQALHSAERRDIIKIRNYVKL